MKKKYLFLSLIPLSLSMFFDASCGIGKKIKIKDIEDFAKIKQNDTVSIENDIDFKNKKIEGFACKKVEGNGHVIKNFIISSSNSEYCGLFLYVDDINNLIIENANIIANDVEKAGIVAGMASNSVTNVHIKNSSATINVNKDRSSYSNCGSGFLVGYSDTSTFNNCSVENSTVSFNNTKSYGEEDFSGISGGRVESISHSYVEKCNFNATSTTGQSINLNGIAKKVDKDATLCMSKGNEFTFTISGVNMPLSEDMGARCSFLTYNTDSINKSLAKANKVKADVYYNFLLYGIACTATNINDCLASYNTFEGIEKGKNGSNKSIIATICDNITENIKHTVALGNIISTNTINKKEVVYGLTNTKTGTLYKCASGRNNFDEVGGDVVYFNEGAAIIVDCLCDKEDLGNGLFGGTYTLLDLSSDFWNVRENEISVKEELFK